MKALKGGCITLILVGFIAGLLLGGTCFNYVLDTVIGKTVPLWLATIASLVTGDLTIPLAVICLVIRHLTHVPLFHI